MVSLFVIRDETHNNLIVYNKNCLNIFWAKIPKVNENVFMKNFRPYANQQ